MSRRTLFLMVLSLAAAVLVVLGIAVTPLLGLIPERTFGRNPAATVSLDLAGQVRELQVQAARLNAALKTQLDTIATLERRLADVQGDTGNDANTDRVRTERIAELEAVLDRERRRNGLLAAKAEALAAEQNDTVRTLAESRERREELERMLASRERDTDRQRGEWAEKFAQQRGLLDSREEEIRRLRNQLAERDNDIERLRTVIEAAGEQTESTDVPTKAPSAFKGTVMVLPSSEESVDIDRRDTLVSEGSASVAAGVTAYMAGDYDTAFANWQPLAEAGQARAQFHLGALYFEGRGVVRDLSQARDWLARAVANGSEPARSLLARVEAERTSQPSR